ncbi:MAG: CPBP family intramembrane metalloprotease [Firmicutes bacterium]|nr:CPBP family intramembrane metalloprotease [Bacillota bacterium]
MLKRTLAVAVLAPLVVPGVVVFLAGTVATLAGVQTSGAVFERMSLLLGAAAGQAALAGGIFALLRTARQRLLPAGNAPPRRLLAEVRTGVLWGVLLFAASTGVDKGTKWFLRGILGAESLGVLVEREEAPVVKLVMGDGPLWLTALAIPVVVILAPLVEELFFRGLLYPALKSSFGRPRAVWGSAAVFAAVHLYVVHFPSVLLAGVLLAYAYDSRGSLITPAVAHAFMNAAVLAVFLFR